MSRLPSSLVVWLPVRHCVFTCTRTYIIHHLSRASPLRRRAQDVSVLPAAVARCMAARPPLCIYLRAHLQYPSSLSRITTPPTSAVRECLACRRRSLYGHLSVTDVHFRHINFLLQPSPHSKPMGKGGGGERGRGGKGVLCFHEHVSQRLYGVFIPYMTTKNVLKFSLKYLALCIFIVFYYIHSNNE